MSDTSKMIVERIGETDQRYLNGNSPELALERGDLLLQLVTLSHNRQERLHFLHEAIAILEQSRVEFVKCRCRCISTCHCNWQKPIWFILN